MQRRWATKRVQRKHKFEPGRRRNGMKPGAARDVESMAVLRPSRRHAAQAHLGNAAGLEHLLQLPLFGCHRCRQLLCTSGAAGTVAASGGGRDGGAAAPPLGPQGARCRRALACGELHMPISGAYLAKMW